MEVTIRGKILTPRGKERLKLEGITLPRKKNDD